MRGRNSLDLRVLYDLKIEVRDMVNRASKIKSDIENGKEIDTRDVVGILDEAEHFVLTKSIIYGFDLDYRKEIGEELDRYKKEVGNGLANENRIYDAVCYTLELFKKFRRKLKV